VLNILLAELPDWMKLAILGTVLETSRRYLTTWYYQIKNSLFLTITFESNDTTYCASSSCSLMHTPHLIH
jgi:hypothetical protein